MTPLWLAPLAGLGLLLFGLKTVSEAVQALAGDRLRRIIGSVGDDRMDGFTAGVLVSALTQSSSVTTIMMVSFVNAGLMTLWQAASVTLGANVGATVTGWVLALELHRIAMALIGVGALVTLRANREVVRFCGQVGLGLGLLFVGLGWIESGAGPLRADVTITSTLSIMGGDTLAHLLLTMALAIIATVVIQSSAAMIGLIIAAGSGGLIDFDCAAALVLGVNVGATVSTLRAAREGNTDSRRVALFHILVNLLGALLLACFFNSWMNGLDTLLPDNPDMLDATGGRPAMAAHVALAHTSFNLLMAAVALPLLNPLLALVTRLLATAAGDRPELKFLRQSMVESPALAIEQCRHEVLHMAAAAAEALQLTRELFNDVDAPRADLRNLILKRERATDTMQHAITVFMSRVMARPLTLAQSEEIRSLIRVADEVESVADYCERLANYRRRMLRESVVLSDAALGELRGYLDRTVAFYDEIVDRARRNETSWLPAIESKAQYLATEADGLRDANLHRLAAQRAAPGEGIFFNDLLVAMRRIRNHALNMAEAFLGKK